MVVKSTHNLMLHFLEKEKDTREIANSYNTNISFRVNNKNVKIILNYKAYFKSRITDLSALPVYYKICYCNK